MESDRFDALSRRVGHETTRRAALGLLVGGLATAVSSSEIAEARHQRKHRRCRRPTHAVCASGRCVNLLTDPLNCGGCGRPCVAAATCINGNCCSRSNPSDCGCAPTGDACNAKTCCLPIGVGQCAKGRCA